MHGEPRSLAAARPDAPPGLVAVVNRCLEKDTERRYQTVAEMVMALVEYAPRRARSVAERAVAITEAAGMLAAAPREALDGTLPEMRMSPLHGLPPPAAPPGPQAPMAATRREQPGDPRATGTPGVATMDPSLQHEMAPPGRPEGDTLDLSITRRRDDPNGSAATWIGVALGLVVVVIFGIGLYLRKHYAPPAPSPAAPDSTAEAPVLPPVPVAPATPPSPSASTSAGGRR
jgi:serine/threonine-protein kinase